MTDWTTAWAWPWWTIMVLINLGNLSFSFLNFRHSRKVQDAGSAAYQKRMRILGVIYCLVAAYRSVFVSDYYPRTAWFDTSLNAALLIRCFAIFAENSFAILITTAMIRFNRYLPPTEKELANKFKNIILTKSPYILIICLVLAQFPATIAVVARSDLLGAIEETLWSIGFLAILPLAFMQLKRILDLQMEFPVLHLQITR